jgi:hypothetical protein
VARSLGGRGPPPRPHTLSRLEDARRFEAERRRQTELGAHAAPEASAMRLGEWLEIWFERGKVEWARSTLKHRAVDKWIVPHLSGVRLRDLGEARIRRWREDIHGAGCSPHQCNQGCGKKRSTRGRIRTCDLWLRRPALYPLSYARESG